MKVETTTCVKCDRVWPCASEQGLHNDLYEQCYSCMITHLIKMREEIIKGLDYVINNCYDCAGLPPKRDDCISCSGNGWVAERLQ